MSQVAMIMKILSYILLIVASTCSVREGLGAAQFVDPPSGSIIADFEGTVNITTVTCNIVNDNGTQISTQWTIVNFRRVSGSQVIDNNLAPELFLFDGDPVPTIPALNFRNRLTLLNLSPDLDRVTIFCGTGVLPEQANFIVRIYRPPILRDNFLVRILEGDLNVPVNLQFVESVAFPEPTDFSWNVNGQPLTNPDQSYSSVNFSTIRRSNAGNYTVFAANYLLDDSTTQIGNDTGSFYLDVLYPPSFAIEGPTQHYALLGNSASLVCGTGLESNPQATITWIASNGTTIVDNTRFDIENGPDIVRLNFTSTIMSDSGIWRCNILAISEWYTVSEGRLILQNESMIGTISVNIQLLVIGPPGQPSAPNINSIGATWAHVSWTAPSVADSPISRYEIIAREVGGSKVVSVTTSTVATFSNVTGLLPSTTYELTVVAISEGGDVIARSPESESMALTTRITVPYLKCSEPVSMGGIIRVSWFYIHTGGLPLTGASVNYSYMNGSSFSVTDESITISDVNTTIIDVSNLVAGFSYTFMITAENRNGSSSISCSSVLHVIGVPFMPKVGALTSGPGVGEVTLHIKTVASGVNNPVQGFQFIITPVQDGQTLDSIPYSFPDYQSGTSVAISVSRLEERKSYTFCVTAMNVFGTSESTKSSLVVAGGPTDTTANNVGAIIGGVVSGLSVMIIIALIIVVIALTIFSRKDAIAINQAETVYEDPDSFQQYMPKKEQNIELRECPAYHKPVSRQPDIELEECPAYVEKKREISNIKLEECPAYVEKKKNLSNIELEECPAYEQLR